MVVLATIFPQQIPFQWQRTGGPGVHWVIYEWKKQTLPPFRIPKGAMKKCTTWQFFI